MNALSKNIYLTDKSQFGTEEETPHSEEEFKGKNINATWSKKGLEKFLYAFFLAQEKE